ncbi:MAG: DNA alkylation repair protein [Pseudomonadales bacterium]|nr:DNA alkylation repair protein [Pseudomonadales bacterium]
MPEALKHCYNEKFINELSTAFELEYQNFNRENFSTNVFSQGWEQLELKARMRRITISLNDCLPNNYSQCLDILVAASNTLNVSDKQGFEMMLFPDFVEYYGSEHIDLSITALEHLTQLASAEFAVRPFILSHPQKMMAQMYTWSKSKNVKLRRLASEGCRPRLPWAMALPEYKKNPKPIIRILEELKNDESLYVRRSVANNLNDISKDHPDLVISLVTPWKGKSQNTDWLIKHACRGLLKNAHPPALRLFGFGKVEHLSISNFRLPDSVNMGEHLSFSFQIESSQPTIGKLRVEYAIDFLKANGQTRRKIFKISESSYQQSSKQVNKRHSFKAISTRKHYSGKHSLAILLNGVETVQQEFALTSH